jgi:hypothetical protein
MELTLENIPELLKRRRAMLQDELRRLNGIERENERRAARSLLENAAAAAAEAVNFREQVRAVVARPGAAGSLKNSASRIIKTL